MLSGSVNKASNLTSWLLANGNIIYTQLEPKLNFRGQTAVGNLETENIVVKGDLSGKRVVTQIVPPAYVPKN